MRLIGCLNIAALEASLNEIVRRHEVLRSVIQVVEGQPQQISVDDSEPKQNILALRDELVSETNVVNYIEEELLEPFDFSGGSFSERDCCGSVEAICIYSDDTSYNVGCLVVGHSQSRDVDIV